MPTANNPYLVLIGRQTQHHTHDHSQRHWINVRVPPESLFLLPVEIGVEVPTKALGRIIEPQLLIQRVDLLDILGLQLEVTLKIGLDASRGFGLGNHAVSLCNAPRQCDLRSILAVFSPNVGQDRVVDQLSDVLALAIVNGIRVAER